jgi:transposase
LYLSLSGRGEAMSIEGYTHAISCEIDVEHVFVLCLKEGQIIVIDTLSVYKGRNMRELSEACGCQVLFLPASSPDVSPIEETFSKRKAALRRGGARTHESLQEAIAAALLTITAADAAGWFRQCGYPVPTERSWITISGNRCSGTLLTREIMLDFWRID